MASYLGDFVEDATVHFIWSTNDSNGASITRGTDGTISVYKDNGLTQSTAGITDTEDFDGVTGIHACTIDTSADAFYAVGSNYSVVLTGAVIDGQNVDVPLAHFSIENRSALRPTTAGRTLDVTAGGEAGIDFDNTSGTISGAQIANNAISSAKIAASAIGATQIASFAITADKISSNAIGASELATDAVNKIRDAILSDSTAFNGADIAAILADTNELQTDDVPGLIAALNDPTAATIADAVWDEIASDHVSQGSFGQLLAPERMGVAQAGSTSSITLDASASSTNDFYNGMLVSIVGGTGANQLSRVISDYNGATKVASVATNNFTTAPDATSEFIITKRVTLSAVKWHTGVVDSFVGGSVVKTKVDTTNGLPNVNAQAIGKEDANAFGNMINSGNAISSLVDSASSPSVFVGDSSDFSGLADDWYKGSIIAFTSGSLQGQARRVASFTASTRTFTMDEPYTTTPSASDSFTLLTWPTLVKADVNAEVLDVLQTDTFAEIGQETPAATQSILKMIQYTYKAWRNKVEQTDSEYRLFNDDAVTVDQKATVSDDGTTFTREEMATGP